MTIRIHTGGLLKKDPESDEPFFVDWGTERLGTGVEIATSTWAITGADADLTDHDDDTGILTGEVFTTDPTGQVTKDHLAGGTLGLIYTVTNTIVTDETPPRTLEKSFQLLIEQE